MVSGIAWWLWGHGLVARRKKAWHSTHMTVMWALRGHVRANLPMFGAKKEKQQGKNIETLLEP